MKSTGIKDKNGREIFYGDTLKCHWGYEVVVTEWAGFTTPVGKLKCESTHPCANIPYSLNADISEVVDDDGIKL